MKLLIAIFISLLLTACSMENAENDNLVLVKRYFTHDEVELRDTLYINKSRYTDTLSAHFSDSIHLKYESFDRYPVYLQVFYPRKPLGKEKIFVIDSIRHGIYHVREMFEYTNGGRFIYLDGKKLTPDGTLSTDYLFITDTSNNLSLVGRFKVETLNVSKLDTNIEYIFYK